jgi:hypothetical protein
VDANERRATATVRVVHGQPYGERSAAFRVGRRSS